MANRLENPLYLFRDMFVYRPATLGGGLCGGFACGELMQFMRGTSVEVPIAALAGVMGGMALGNLLDRRRARQATNYLDQTSTPSSQESL